MFNWDEIKAWAFELITTTGVRLLAAIAVLIIGSLLIKVIIRHFPDGKKHHALDPTVKSFLRSFISIALWIVLIVCVVAILGVPMASVVAAIASAGLAIGLALQGSLSNLAGGIMILLFRPFRVNDYIESSGNGGTVVDLGIFYTVLRTPDNKHITIPNGTLMNASITNYSQEKLRRVDIDFSIAYDADAELACRLASECVDAHPLAMKAPDPFCRVTSLGDSSCTVTVRVWVEAGDFWTVKHDLINNVREAFDASGIEIPYPQLDVHIRDGKNAVEKKEDD